MCVSSVIMDDFNRRWATPNQPNIIPQYQWAVNMPTRAEFEQLKKEVSELRDLLKAAKKFDDATGQPDCESADKLALIKKLAELVGVDLGDVIP